MKVIIFAAGEGKRMRPLTDKRPKPMVHLKGRPLMEHLLEILPEEIDEVVMVVGYLAEHIKNHFGEKFGRFRINYIHQEKPLGTAHALSLCRHLVGSERFMTLYADDLHGADDLKELLGHPLSVLVKEVSNPERFGVVEVHPEGHVLEIIEKPDKPKSNLVVTGPAILDGRIFDYEARCHPNGEYFLAEAIGELVRDHRVVAVRQKFWLPIGYPEDLERAEEILSKII